MRKIIEKSKITAILRGIPPEEALDFAKICIEGGVKAFEVALNQENALECIEKIKAALGDRLIVGAGTAINVDLAKSAVNAGAEFLLTPAVNEKVLEYAVVNKIKLLPGVLTPTDVGICVNYGFDTMKLFPAAMFAMNYVQLLKGPFDGTDYVAVGGVTRENLRDFYSAGYIGAGIGGGLFDRSLLHEKKFDEAIKQVRELTEIK